ncbi:MAG TPA: hypothetical protein VF173_23240 [Thermoanaerobaculia bacterium]|nr:hypothetical protein [Thermoanaerobaculia bacterium]
MTVPPTPASARVRLLPLGPSPFAVQLLRAEGAEPGADPFLRAAGRDAGVRAYLAVLTSETGAVLDRLVVELPGDAPGEPPFPEEEPPANAAVEAEWAATHRDLVKLLAAPAQFPELIAPAEPGEAGLLPPTLFCAASGRLFRIPCPACFGPLRTCRDDARLAAAGLPLYSATAARFLVCPACLETSRFWVGTAAEARGLEGVGTLEDLRREYAAALERAGGAREDLPAAGPPPPAAPTGRKAAAAAPPAAAPTPAWTVLNLHDSPFLVTRMAPVAFDDFLARLGGGAEERVGEGGPGFLFAAEGSGIDAVELLALKLAAFLQIVSAVRRHYLLLGRPHLDLQPDHLAVEPGLEAGFLPVLWSFRVKLLGASPARLANLAPGLQVALPPREPRTPFASPAVRAARLASPARGELMIERVAAEKEGRWRIEGKLLDAHGFFPPPTPRDWIQLAWPRDPFGQARPGVARLDPRSAADSVEMAITTEPLELDPALAQRLGRAGGFRVPGVRYKIYPALSAPEDVYSLGVLLLRILLVNDGQTLSALEPLIEAVPQGAGQAVRGARRTVEEALSAMLAAEPQRLAKANLFHRETDRGPGRPNSIPEEIWTSALLFALRLVGRGPGFGLTPERGGAYGFNETHPVAHLDEVQAEAEDLLRRLHGILFHRQAVNVEVQALIAELLAEEGGGAEKQERLPTDRMKT